MSSSEDQVQHQFKGSLDKRLLGLPFEARPTEIPPDSPRALDAMERALRWLSSESKPTP